MSWLHQTIEDVRIIGANDLFSMLTFIDSAHAVHPNMRGHTGGATTFGIGIIDQKSHKQKNEYEKFDRDGSRWYK